MKRVGDQYPNGRKKLPHDLSPWLKPDEEIFFITVCCLPRGQNQLCVPRIGQLLLETIAFQNEIEAWYVHLALLMPDHLHLLVSFPPASIMSDVIKRWKSFTARTLKVKWQRDFFDHRLRRDESFCQKEDYIRNNPVRAGLVRRADDWLYVWPPPAGATGPSRPT